MDNISHKSGFSPEKATFIFAIFAAGIILCVGGILFTIGALPQQQLYNAALFAIAVVVIILPVFFLLSLWQTKLFSSKYEALKENNQQESTKLLQLMDSSLQGIIVTRDGNVIYGNSSACNALGYDRTSILGIELQSICCSDLPDIDDVMSPAEEPGKIATPTELKMRSRSGGELYLQAVFQKDNWKQMPVMTVIFSNITHQKKNEDSIRRQRRFETVGRLTGGVAHDFNNFLAIILGNLEVIDEKLQGEGICDTEKLQSRIKKSIDAAERGARLVEQLVSYSQKQMLTPVELQLNDFLRDTELLFRSILGSRIYFEIDRLADVRTVHIDPGRLEDALINLLFILREGPKATDSIKMATKEVELNSNTVFPGQSEFAVGYYSVLSIDQGLNGVDMDLLEKAEDPFISDQKFIDRSALVVSAILGFVKQSGGLYNVEKSNAGNNILNLYFPRR